MLEDAHAPVAEPTTEPAAPTAAPAMAAPDATPAQRARWERDVRLRLEQGASAQEVARFLAQHVPTEEREQYAAMANAIRGNAFWDQVLTAAAQTSSSVLSGRMLVSNNPEGLDSPGTIITAEIAAGRIAAYIHHSNHTTTDLAMFLVVTPTGAGPVTVAMSGASAATGTSKRAQGNGGALWSKDPNVLVAAAMEARDDGTGAGRDRDLDLRTNLVKTDATAMALPLGKLPRKRGGDPPLFDARYDLELSGDAKLAVVAEPAGASAAAGAIAEDEFAVGNTKYEKSSTHGRAAGVYEGANWRSDDTYLLSQLPSRRYLTGSKFDSFAGKAENPSLVSGGSMQVVGPSAAVLAAARDKAGRSIDAATVYLAEEVFRISAHWLREKHAWNGTALTPSALSGDYVTILDGLRTALRADLASGNDDAVKAHVDANRNLGATVDAASYGTMFDVAILVDNDTASAGAFALNFITDFKAEEAGATKGNIYRGLVSVDGVDHPINHDTASGRQVEVTLGGAARLEPGAAKYVHIQFLSPGQISTNQALEVQKR
ncbi:MAG: hypothetical protein R2939_16670 [Kofleriaceae bacterium]